MSQLVNTGISAAGATLAAATALTQLNVYNQVSTSAFAATAPGVNLPTNPIANQMYYVRNDGAFICNVYPGNASSLINGLAAGVAYPISSGQMVGFITSSNTNVATPVIQWYAISLSNGATAMAISAAYTIPAALASATFAVTSAAANYSITLPAVASSNGNRYRFYLTATAGTNSTTIACPAGTCNSACLTTSGVAGTCVFHTQAAGASVAFNTHASVADYIDACCDGTNWNLSGMASNATAGFTYA